MPSSRPTTDQLRQLLPVVILGSTLVTLLLVVIAFVLHDIGSFNDFRREAWPAYRALGHGHVLAFLRLGPAYVGSLVLRAPFALIALALGGGWRATYFATALPCLLAAVLFGAMLLLTPVPSPGRGVASRVSPAILCALNPAVIVGLGDGHPEEVLGAVLCAAAVVLALRGSAGLAGLLIGLAVINKSWAVVAIPVVLAALPADRRRAVLVMTATIAAVLVPVYLARGQSSVGGAAATFGAQAGTLFQYPQLLWWLGPNAWVVREAHMLLVAACIACGALWWVTRGRRPAPFAERWTPVLNLLCLVFLLRAALDPWDNYYYHLPFLFALMTLEARRAPVLTVAYSLVLLVVVPLDTLGGSPTFQAAAYAIVTVPTLLWLGARAFTGPGRPLNGRRAPGLPAIRKIAGRLVT